MAHNLTYLQAIEKVLQQSDRPLTPRQILHRLEENDYVDLDNAQTPATAIRARISEDINRNKEKSVFIRLRPGLFDLREKANVKNFFLVIEGLDGTGKTEVAHQLARLLERTHSGRVMLTFEPHDPSSSGYFIRQVLSDEFDAVSDEVLALAFATNRADHCERLIEPFLSNTDERICICDRYYLSSLVYQSTSETDFQKIMDLNFAARKPDLTIFLSASTKTCYKRMKARQQDKERFEKDLNRTREQYRKAIEFLKRERGETVVEVNADGNLAEVLEQVGQQLTGPNGADWIVWQPQLAMEKTPISSLSFKNDFTIIDFSREFEDRWYYILSLKNEFIPESVDELRLEVREAIDRLAIDKVSELFTDLLKMLGYQKSSRLPWSEVDAVRLKYHLPHVPDDITLIGAAFVMESVHRQSVITKKVLEEKRFFDFVMVLDLRKTQFVEDYNRDPLVKGERSLPPATATVSRKDIADIALLVSLKSYLDQSYNTPFFRDKVKKILEVDNLVDYWDKIKF